MTLFVSDVHPINLPLLWLLSFLVEVRALRVHPRCWRPLAGRIASIDIGRLVDADEAPYFRSECVAQWAPLGERLTEKDWHISYRGELDLSVKAKQDLAQAFQDLSLLRKFEAHDAGAHAIVSAQHRYIEGLESQRERRPQHIRWIALLNVLADLLWLHLTNIAMALASGGVLLRGLATTRSSSAGLSTATCIYHAVNVDESTLSSQRRYAFWTVDGHTLRPEEIIFVLPRTADPTFRREVESSTYRAGTLDELLSDLPLRSLVRSVAEFGTLLITYPFRFWSGVTGPMRARYLINIQQWDPLVDWLQPETYVSGMGSSGYEIPALLALRRRGIQTVMYCGAANSYPFTRNRRGCDFRKAVWAHILVSVVVVWNEDFKVYVESHPQDGVKVHALGPLMPGDETVMTIPTDQLRSNYGIGPDDGVPRSVVSVFDVAAKSAGVQRSEGIYPNPYSAAYATAFLRDVVRLLNAFEDIVIVYKPKRDIGSSGHTFPPEFRTLVKTIADHPRGVVLASDINPWLPIAASDLSISMTFTSGALAASHYGKSALFHDPLGQAHEHRYRQLDPMITHNYSELVTSARALLDGDVQAPSSIRRFIGPVPDTDSTAAFRKLIVNGSTDHTGVESVDYKASSARPDVDVAGELRSCGTSE